MIVDIGLSEGNGVSAVETIRRSEPIPYLYMSGDLSKIRALKPDAVALHKPFHEPDLAGAIQCALTSTAS
jgi:CheY-like chemotaxis protein